MAATSYDVSGIRVCTTHFKAASGCRLLTMSFLLLFLRAGIALGAPLEHPLVVTQLPAGGSKVTAGGMLRADFGEGARLVLVAVDGTTRVLSEGLHSACDAALSFEGDRLLFAGKRAAEDAWNIFEMTVDGSEVRQITRGLGDCRSPGYQSSLYTLRPV
ncbi:MAG: TolB-like translocation protein, partial [Planctomycetota bacterium]